MRDEDFEIFIDELGEATSKQLVPLSSFNKYQDVLPDVLLKYWKEEGWCSYSNGLFWTVNPEEYEHIIDIWLEDTVFEEIDTYHVIARTAFGELFAWGEKYNREITISCPTNNIIALLDEVKISSRDPELEMQTFFAMATKEAFDMEDDSGNSLFTQAMSKLGKLSEQEIYGFEPALILGGAMNIDNIVKLNADVHFNILRQLSEPNVTTLDYK